MLSSPIQRTTTCFLTSMHWLGLYLWEIVRVRFEKKAQAFNAAAHFLAGSTSSKFSAEKSTLVKSKHKTLLRNVERIVRGSTYISCRRPFHFRRFCTWILGRIVEAWNLGSPGGPSLCLSRGFGSWTNRLSSLGVRTFCKTFIFN